MSGAAAALVLAPAPAGEPLPGLAALLGADRRARLRALLVGRAAEWAAAVAPGAAFVAGPGPLEDLRPLVPAGVEPFATGAADPAGLLAAAVARAGAGPLLIASADCPRLSRSHADAALADLEGGCDLTVGPTLERGWYLCGLREPRPELVAVADPALVGEGAFQVIVARAAEAGAEIGVLRHERLLLTPADAAAHLADPLLPADVRAALAPPSGSG